MDSQLLISGKYAEKDVSVTRPANLGANVEDIAHKRAVLLSARMQFSPETQAIKAAAIDQIIKQNLFVGDQGSGLTAREIQNQVPAGFVGGVPIADKIDVDYSVERLCDAGSLEIVAGTGNPNNPRFKLTSAEQKQQIYIQQEAETRLDSVIERLFGNAQGGAAQYAGVFMKCLCVIFARLGLMYARVLQRVESQDDLLRAANLERVIAQVSKEYRIRDPELFRTALTAFFREADPAYDAIKWNLAQSYFIAQALGVDSTGKLLSKDLFGGATFYLDTNVMLDALEPTAAHHSSFRALSMACQELDIKIRVCTRSIEELRSVTTHHIGLIRQTEGQIPDATIPKVNDIFFQIYKEAEKADGGTNLEEIFERFLDPMPHLTQFGVEELDDPWFSESLGEPMTGCYIDAIQQAIEEKRGYKKYSGTAEHDALLLRWVNREQKLVNPKAYLVTRDTSLARACVKLKTQDDISGQLTVGLDALLQWISPVAVPENDEDHMAQLFAEAIRYQLLPMNSIFKLGDFVGLAQIGYQCKELPAEDVEGFVLHLRTHAPMLDVSKAQDREKLLREANGYFADPSRKHHQEVQRLEEVVRTVKAESVGYAEAQQALNIQNHDLNAELLELKQKLTNEEGNRQAALRREAYLRAALAGVFWLAGIPLVGWFIHENSTGSSFMEQIIAAWPVVTPLFVAMLFISVYVIIGQQAISILGWPLPQFGKNDDRDSKN